MFNGDDQWHPRQAMLTLAVGGRALEIPLADSRAHLIRPLILCLDPRANIGQATYPEDYAMLGDDRIRSWRSRPWPLDRTWPAIFHPAEVCSRRPQLLDSPQRGFDPGRRQAVGLPEPRGRVREKNLDIDNGSRSFDWVDDRNLPLAEDRNRLDPASVWPLNQPCRWFECNHKSVSKQNEGFL